MPESFISEYTISRGAMYNSLINFHTIEAWIRRKSIINDNNFHFCRNKCICDHGRVLTYKYSEDLQLLNIFIYMGDNEVALQWCI